MENYFELYGLPEQFGTDKTAVRKNFLALSRENHPDRFATADESTQAAALKSASANNAAYKILMDEDKTMQYLLRLRNTISEDEKYTLPQAFLMEMMDLNEVVSEYKMAPDSTHRQIAYDTLAQEIDKWKVAAQPLLEKHDAGNTGQEILAKIKDFYYRRKYLLRIQERLDTFAL